MSAIFSPCRTYRYRLEREFAPRLDAPGGTCAFIMLNPSTADETANDPTIRRCIGFAQSWGFSHLIIGNLFALRSTDPAALYSAPAPVGPDNDMHLKSIGDEAELVVAAWGVHGAYQWRDRDVRRLLHPRGVDLHHLGLTKHGRPKHPLYLKSTTKPEPWGAP